jgi:hypothetical protein
MDPNRPVVTAIRNVPPSLIGRALAPETAKAETAIAARTARRTFGRTLLKLNRSYGVATRAEWLGRSHRHVYAIRNLSQEEVR